MRGQSTSLPTLLALVILLILLWAFFRAFWPASSLVLMTRTLPPGCIAVGSVHQLCVASDMSRPAQTEEFEIEHGALDLSDGRVLLHAARNETVAFQLLFRRISDLVQDNVVDIVPGPWRLIQTPTTKQVRVHQQLFYAHYLQIEKGGYTWGPETQVLPWPAAYPDALIPMVEPCNARKPLLSSLPLAREAMQNQAVWIDTFVPPETPAGLYRQEVIVRIGEHRAAVTVDWQVHEVTLPDEPTIDAVGEIYLAYGVEGVGFDISEPDWRALAQCYQKLAHQHRMVFIERFPKGISDERLPAYVETFGPALTGELFTEANAYVGPGLNTPVTVWRTPWPQRIDLAVDEPISEQALRETTRLASAWQSLVQAQGWTSAQYFAYVFDEVDGPPASGVTTLEHRRYVEMAHEQMGLVQQAIDAGANEQAIDLIWTSHSNPAQWQDDPALDLSGRIRLWAPNASAADPDFLKRRMQLGESAWFYHSGHPAIGAHSINASGIEMRTWGVIGARYGFDGQLMWAVNLGSQSEPFAQPSYKPEDDRVGNGVLVYPGHQLTQLAGQLTGMGLRSAPGPIPSMRLKAWRRGLQDAELYKLAAARKPEQARALIEALVPRALALGQGEPSWPDDPARWIDFRVSLLRMAAQ